MSNNPEPIEVSIVAKIQSLLDGMAQATGSVKSATGEMGNALGSMGSIVDNLKAPFLAITGILAGGAMFKDAMDATVKWNGEAIKLAGTLGITTEQASILNVALGDIYSSSDEYLHAVGMMTRQINSGGEGFKKLGLEVKDANGEMKPAGQLMQEALEKLNGMEQGINRNAAGMAIFGRGWGEAQKLLKLNAEVMEEAKQKAEKLNLIVGGDAVEAQKKYKAAMNDMQDGLLGVKLAVGQDLLPVFSDMALMFADILPPVVKVLSYAIKGLVTGFQTLKVIIQAVGAIVGGIFGAIMDSASAVGEAFVKLLKGDFSGAADAAGRAAQAIKNNFLATKEVIGESYDDLGKKLAQVWDGSGSGATRVGKQGSALFDPEKGKDNSEEILRRFKTQLEQMKDAEGNWFTWSDARELAFWQEKLAQVDKGSKAYLAILSEENKLRRKIAEEEQAKLKADFETRLEAQKFNSEARVNMAMQEADRIANTYGFESKQFAEAMKKVEEERQKHNEKMRQLRMAQVENDAQGQQALLDLELERTRRAASVGAITREQELAALRLYENNRYQIQLAAAQKAKDLEADPVKKQEAMNKIEALERQHVARMAQIDTQALQQSKQRWDTWFNGITSGFQNAISGLIKGTQTWGDAWRNILGSMEDWLIQKSINMAMQWVSDRLFEQAMGKASRSAEVVGAASVYAVNAMASVAAIPVVGWSMAPGVGAAAFAQGMGFLPSAAKGWDKVPQDTLAAIHKDEMVMPANLAQGIRDMVASGGARRGGGDSYHITVQAMDSASFSRFLSTPANQGALVKATKQITRNGRTA